MPDFVADLQPPDVPASPELEGILCDMESLCFNLIDDKLWGIGLELLVLIYAFVGVAIVADAHLVLPLAQALLVAGMHLHALILLDAYPSHFSPQGAIHIPCVLTPRCRCQVPGLETLCVRWSIPEDVAGASFMAFGSAAPEITINAISTIKAVLSGAGPLTLQPPPSSLHPLPSTVKAQAS